MFNVKKYVVYYLLNVYNVKLYNIYVCMINKFVKFWGLLLGIKL